MARRLQLRPFARKVFISPRLFCVVQIMVSGRPMGHRPGAPHEAPPPEARRLDLEGKLPDAGGERRRSRLGERSPRPSASVGNERLFLRDPPSAAGTSRLAIPAPRVPPHSPALQTLPRSSRRRLRHADRRDSHQVLPFSAIRPGGQDALPLRASVQGGRPNVRA